MVRGRRRLRPGGCNLCSLDCLNCQAASKEYTPIRTTAHGLLQVPERIGVALLRGTSADPDGNVSFEKEAVYADQLDQVGRR